MTVSLLTSLGLLTLAVFTWASRIWAKKFVERQVDARFEQKLEALRSDLRIKEAEIQALQTSVLGMQSGRRAIVEKRQVQALEAIWTATRDLSKFKIVSTLNSIIQFADLKAGSSEAIKMREFVKKTLPNAFDNPTKFIGDLAGYAERPFLAQPVWASFAAYQSILLAAYTQLMAFTLNVKSSKPLYDDLLVVKLAKEALPSHGSIIEKDGSKSLNFLLEPLEEQIIVAIQQALDGVDLEQAELDRAARVITLVRKVSGTAKEADPGLIGAVWGAKEW